MSAEDEPLDSVNHAASEAAASKAVEPAIKRLLDFLVSATDFLVGVAPGRRVVIRVQELKQQRQAIRYVLEWPEELQLHCSNETCTGNRVFRNLGASFYPLSKTATQRGIVTYRCRNCEQSDKEFAVAVGRVTATEDEKIPFLTAAAKIGELPPFGGPLPRELLNLAADASEYLVKGHQAEALGLGLGAFAYYRRFVDHQKNLLFDRIIEVAELENVGEGIVAEIRDAKREHSFSRSMKVVNLGVPPSLLIRGQNPLSLLHSALSVNLHTENDSSCLELATNVRTVLAALAENLSRALAKDEEVKKAVAALAAAKSRSKRRTE